MSGLTVAFSSLFVSYKVSSVWLCRLAEIKSLQHYYVEDILSVFFLCKKNYRIKVKIKRLEEKIKLS